MTATAALARVEKPRVNGRIPLHTPKQVFEVADRLAAEGQAVTAYGLFKAFGRKGRFSLFHRLVKIWELPPDQREAALEAISEESVRAREARARAKAGAEDESDGRVFSPKKVREKIARAGLAPRGCVLAGDNGKVFAVISIGDGNVILGKDDGKNENPRYFGSIDGAVSAMQDCGITHVLIDVSCGFMSRGKRR